MGHSDELNIDIKRAVYSFVLSLYETFERVGKQSVLVNDIETLGNRALGLVARFGVSDDKSRITKDILGELKAIRGLLGVVRDINIVERGTAMNMLVECRKLEDIFNEMASGNNGLVENEKNSHSAINDANNGMPVRSVEAAKERLPNIGAKVSDRSSGGLHGLSARQTAIMEVLKRRDKITVSELGLLFSGRVSKKTLQRDLQEMVEQSMVKKEGDRRWTSYFL